MGDTWYQHDGVCLYDLYKKYTPPQGGGAGLAAFLYLSRMRSVRDEGTKKLPFVKLPSTVDKEAHKKPLERGWQNKTYSPDDVLRWVQYGHGVGLNIAGTGRLAVVDIDQTGEAADAIARWCGERGALVCATPSGGYHIFISRRTFPQNDGRYNLRTPLGAIAVEWYRGDNARQVVLPIAGTPRAKLGGHVVWANGKPYGEAVSAATMLELLADASGVVLSDASLEFRDGDDDEGVIKRLFGKPLGELTQEDVLIRVRQAQQGERHNVLLRAGLVFRMRGWSLEKLRETGLIVFAGERTAAEEVEGILRWVESRKVAPWSEVAAAQVQRGKATFADLVEAVFGGSVEWYAEGDDTYVLSDGVAILGADGLGSYFAAQDIALGPERAKRFITYIRHTYPRRPYAFILRDFPLLHEGRFTLGVRVDGQVWALVAGGGDFELRDPRDIGAYVLWGAEYRAVNRADIQQADRISASLLAMLSSFFVRSDTVAGDIALLIAATVMAKSIVFITGESGSGKSTLSLLLQYIINGRPSTLSTKDDRDFNATSAGNRLVAFEEVDGLDESFWSKIKIFTTFGELSQRTLYTNKGITVISANASYVFATTNIKGMPGDVLRRAVHFSTSIYRRAFVEDLFINKLRSEGGRYVIGLMWLLRNWWSAEAAMSLHQMLTENIQFYDLPEWLARANKADLTRAYYYMCRELRVDEAQARRAWEKAREGAAARGLGIWGEIMQKAEEDENFAARLREGLSAADIASVLEMEVRSVRTRLANDALKVAPIISEMGWVLAVHDSKSKYRNNVKTYILYKDEQQSQKT